MDEFMDPWLCVMKLRDRWPDWHDLTPAEQDRLLREALAQGEPVEVVHALRDHEYLNGFLPEGTSVRLLGGLFPLVHTLPD